MALPPAAVFAVAIMGLCTVLLTWSTQSTDWKTGQELNTNGTATGVTFTLGLWQVCTDASGDSTVSAPVTSGQCTQIQYNGDICWDCCCTGCVATVATCTLCPGSPYCQIANVDRYRSVRVNSIMACIGSGVATVVMLLTFIFSEKNRFLYFIVLLWAAMAVTQGLIAWASFVGGGGISDNSFLTWSSTSFGGAFDMFVVGWVGVIIASFLWGYTAFTLPSTK